MSIENYLKNIETAIHENDIMKVLKEIKIARTNFPFNTKVNKLIQKNKTIFSRKFYVNENEIYSIFNTLQTSEAIKKLQKFFLQKPNNALLNSILGNLYGLQNDFQKAQNFQEKAISLNPFDDIPYINLSKTFEKQGNFKASLKILLFAEIINPENYEIHIALARAYYRTKNYIKSKESYEIVLKNNNTSNLKLEYCSKLLKLKETKKIFQILNTIKEEENFNEKIMLEGLVYFSEKKIDLAIETFLKALKSNKKQNNILFSYLALCFEEKNEFNKALVYHEKARKIKPENDLVLKNYANHLYFVGNLEKAEKYYLKTIKINQFDFELKYFLSLLQLSKNNYKEGWKNFEYRWLSDTFSTKEKKK